MLNYIIIVKHKLEHRKCQRNSRNNMVYRACIYNIRYMCRSLLLGKTVIVGRGKVALIGARMQMMRMHWRSGDYARRRMMMAVHAAVVKICARLVRIGGCATQELCHEANVGDGQSQRLDARQSLLVGERGHLATQLVERLVQVEHATALANIGSTALSH